MRRVSIEIAVAALKGLAGLGDRCREPSSHQRRLSPQSRSPPRRHAEQACLRCVDVVKRQKRRDLFELRAARRDEQSVEIDVAPRVQRLQLFRTLALLLELLAELHERRSARIVLGHLAHRARHVIGILREVLRPHQRAAADRHRLGEIVDHLMTVWGVGRQRGEPQDALIAGVFDHTKNLFARQQPDQI